MTETTKTIASGLLLALAVAWIVSGFLGLT